MAQIASFAIPLSSFAFAIWVLLGAAGLALGLRRFSRSASGDWNARHFAAIAMCFAGGLLAAYRLSSMDTVGHDTNLYHFSWIRWANEYPAVPGLANLHSRLALNSGFLLLSALADNAWWDGRTAWIMAGLFTVLAYCRLTWIAFGLGRGNSNSARVFSIIALPYSIGCITRIIPELSYDKPTLLLQVLIFQEFLLKRKALLGPSPEAASKRLGHILLLATLGFVFKPIGVITLFLISLFAIQRLSSSKSGFKATVMRAISIGILPAFLIATYIGRNVALSGWPLFPAPVLKLDLDWTLPELPAGDSHGQEIQSASGLYQVIKAWAKTPSIEYKRTIDEGFAFWFPTWKEGFAKTPEFTVLILSVALILLYIAWLIILRRQSAVDGFSLFLLFASYANLAFWFYSAPDIRFGDGLFWICLSLSATLLFSNFSIHKKAKLGLAAFGLALPLTWLVAEAPSLKLPASWSISKAQPWPTATRYISTGGDSGFEVRVPLHQDICGDAPLPCTPYLMPALRLRNAPSLRNGFRIDPSPLQIGQRGIYTDAEGNRFVELNFTTGWSSLESTNADFWRWCSGSGTIVCEIGGSEPLAASFLFQLRSISSRTIDMQINGERAQTIAYSAPGTSMHEIPLTLEPGKNTIELSTNSPPDSVAGDPRALAFAVYNFKLRAHAAENENGGRGK